MFPALETFPFRGLAVGRGIFRDGVAGVFGPTIKKLSQLADFGGVFFIRSEVAQLMRVFAQIVQLQCGAWFLKNIELVFVELTRGVHLPEFGPGGVARIALHA